MLERIHEHIVSELGQSSRTDTIFVVAAILFDLIVLGINSATSSPAVHNHSTESGSAATDIVLVVFILMMLIVNAIAGLYLGRQTRNKLSPEVGDGTCSNSSGPTRQLRNFFISQSLLPVQLCS